MSKKSRGPNFSQNEKEIIIHLIEKYKAVVENKKTDGVTLSTKNEGWVKLTTEFNSLISFCNRNTEQLKTCWDNIKRTTRKAKAATKRESMLTGGGRPDINPPQPFQVQVETLLGPTLDGLENVYDSDIHFLEDNVIKKTHDSNIQFLEDNNKIIHVELEEDTESDANKTDSALSQEQEVNKENILPDNTANVWKNWTPAALKTKVSNPLKQNNNNSQSPWLYRRRPKLSLQDKVLQNKIELIEILKKNAENEAELRTKLLEEQIKQEKIKTQILILDLEQKKL